MPMSAALSAVDAIEPASVRRRLDGGCASVSVWECSAWINEKKLKLRLSIMANKDGG